MFTGLVDHTGQIIATHDLNQGLELTIATQFDDLQLGESIAVNGTCLTVTETDGKTFTCELSMETLQITHCGELDVGDAVNIERALRVGDRLGGHWLTGHVDCTARVCYIDPQDEFTVMRFTDIEAEHQPLLITKGCIAVDGVSLTVNRVFGHGFEVTLIPHTMEITQLDYKSVGDPVNIEFDLMCKTVINTLQNIQAQQQIALMQP